MKTPLLSQLLKKMSELGKLSQEEKDQLEQETKDLQLKMLRIQQGIYKRKDRVILVFEGFDASGKGGSIRRLTEVLDPRGFTVVPIGPPDPVEQGTHWLFRFWKNLPHPGHITIFDRSWYGRVLVEKVEDLTPKEKLQHAYREINEFESQLQNDGITLIKFFMGITKDEQYERFQDRLNDPYKQWKLTKEDIKARDKWDEYVKAVDLLLTKTSTPKSTWHLIAGNSKKLARRDVLKAVTTRLSFWSRWMDQEAARSPRKSNLAKLLKKF